MHASNPERVCHDQPMTEAELAVRGGVTVERIRRLVDLGILVPSKTEPPFTEADVRRVRLAEACAAAGLAVEAISLAIGSGRLSLSFLDHPAYGGWSAHSDSAFEEVAGATGVSAEVLMAMREALGFEMPAPEDAIREDELHVVPIVRMGLESGLDPDGIMRMLRVYGEALTRIAEAEAVIYRRHMRSPLRRADERSGEASIAEEAGGRFVPLVEEALLAIYHRQQERVWLQNLIEGIEDALEEEGLAVRVERPPAICFLDLTGYTAFTEDQGDETAAHLVARVGDVVQGGGGPSRGQGRQVVGRRRDALLSRASLRCARRPAGCV